MIKWGMRIWSWKLFKIDQVVDRCDDNNKIFYFLFFYFIFYFFYYFFIYFFFLKNALLCKTSTQNYKYFKFSWSLTLSSVTQYHLTQLGPFIPKWPLINETQLSRKLIKIFHSNFQNNILIPQGSQTKGKKWWLWKKILKVTWCNMASKIPFTITNFGQKLSVTQPIFAQIQWFFLFQYQFSA